MINKFQHSRCMETWHHHFSSGFIYQGLEFKVIVANECTSHPSILKTCMPDRFVVNFKCVSHTLIWVLETHSVLDIGKIPNLLDAWVRRVVCACLTYELSTVLMNRCTLLFHNNTKCRLWSTHFVIYSYTGCASSTSLPDYLFLRTIWKENSNLRSSS